MEAVCLDVPWKASFVFKAFTENTPSGVYMYVG